ICMTSARPRSERSATAKITRDLRIEAVRLPSRRTESYHLVAIHSEVPPPRSDAVAELEDVLLRFTFTARTSDWRLRRAWGARPRWRRAGATGRRRAHARYR